MRGIRQDRIVRTISLLVGAFCATACAGTGTPALGSTPVPPAATPTASAPTPTCTPSPVPTARPIAEARSEPGAYHDEILGVSLEYPPDWEVFGIHADESHLLSVGRPDASLYVVLETAALGQDENFRAVAHEMFIAFQAELELDSLDFVKIGPDYPLPDGTSAWRGTGEGVDSRSGEGVRFELLAVQRENRLFALSMFGTVDLYETEGQALEDIRQSFRAFAPLPYGVDRANALFLAAEEPLTFDPARWPFGATGILGDLYSGLVQLDTNLRPIPDLAENWEVNPDGTVYTFYLRRNVTFHDGRPFTARDVLYSWERALNPETESYTAAIYLGDIVGVSEVAAGEATHISGMRLVDDYTIQITLNAPKAYFLSKLAYPASWIVDRETADQIETQPNGTGPFALVRHTQDEIIVLARHANYHRGYVPLEYVVYLLYAGPRVRLYEAGDIDLTYIDEDLVARADDPSDPLFGTVHVVNNLCTYYVLFDVSQPPFDDPLVRRAFALAIDTERYNEIVLEGRGVIARGLYPPGLPGYNPAVTSPGYNPEEALRSLSQSSYGSPAQLPEIVFTSYGTSLDIDPEDAFPIQMWEETLGVTISVEQLDRDSYYHEVYAGRHGQVLLWSWCADYPDPENFADILFHSQSPLNLGHYSNPEVDALLEQARVEDDVETRLALYQRIEQMIVDDTPAVFINHSRAYHIVTKPYLNGYVGAPIGVAQHMNFSIEREE